ncbi:PAS domain S-box protein [Caldimonas tepidiphila]|uniref:PAS domain S-box protein n=1 Tax=Caldimonas tepidiphila TaxID=2315841 RepID=UPI001474C650|nr:PAS domain S-box protein [Caldimonas tepidiphila]
MSEHVHTPPIDFQRLLARSSEAVVVHDAEGRILFWNRGAEELYGHETGDALGRRCDELLRTEFPLPQGQLARALQASGRWAGTLVRLHRDGHRVAVRSAWTCDPGRPEGTSVILETSSRLDGPGRGVDDWSHERQTLESLIHALPVGVALVGAGGALVTANEAAMRLHGVASREELVPRLLPHVERIDARLPAGGLAARQDPLSPGCGPAATGDEPACGDGAASRVSCTVVPLPGGSGAEPLSMLLMQDLTECRRSEEALRQADERLRENQRRLDALLTNASVAIFMMDERYHCIYMNPAAEQLSGYRLHEMEGRTLHDVVHHTRPDGSHMPIEECPIGRALPGNDRARGEEVFVHKDGSFYPVAFNAAPIRDERGTILGTILEVRDIREEKRTLEALREADRAKDEFMAMLGHELRNPLSPIVTCLQLMRLRGMQARELEIIARQAQHLTRLVDDLLDVSRISRGLIELRTARLEVAEAIARSVEIARPVLEQGAHRLVLDVPACGLPVEGDADRLSQVVSNLLVNAAKFSPERSTVRLGAWAEADDTVRVSVRDEGQGIAPDMLARIFEAFVQDGRGKDQSRSGLGLGLAIARNLVRLHGGSIEARSEGIGRGAEFLISLPRAEPVAPAPAVETPPGPRPVLSRRILVVDDNRDAAETLRQLLEDSSHLVLAVHDAATALEHAGDFRPDVAILDIDLPVMDGHELAAKLRELFPGQDGLRLIALTGYGLPRDRELSARAGFDVHLVKPLDVERLMEALG